jgi:hypothetical protein
MLVRDVRTGNLVAVPDNRFYGAPAGYGGFGEHAPPAARGFGYAPGLGYYGAAPQQVIYDGLGNPLGLPFLAALLPAAASILPSIIGGAAKALPAVANVAGGLPGILSKVAGGLPSIAGKILPMLTGGGGAPAPAPMLPTPMPMLPPLPMPFAPPPPAGPPAMAPHEDTVARVRMRTTDGQMVDMPIRVRRRRRGRHRGTVRMVTRYVPPPDPTPVRRMQTQRSFDGWPGLHGWAVY